MQRRPTVGPGSQWHPFGNVSPEQFPNWVRVQHCKGGKHGEVGGWGEYGIAKVASMGSMGRWEVTLVTLASSLIFYLFRMGFSFLVSRFSFAFFGACLFY